MTHPDTQPKVPILFIASGSSAGGAEVHLARLVRELAHGAYRITVLCKQGSFLERTLTGQSVDIWTADIPHWRKLGGRLRMPFFISRMTAKAKRASIALVVSNDFRTAPHALSIAEKMGIPTVSMIQDSIVDAKKSRDYLLNHCGALIAVSESMGARLAQCLPESSLKVIPCGVDASEFRPDIDTAPLRHSLGIADGEILVLAVGQVCVMKGQDRLFDALLEDLQKGDSYHIVLCGRSDTALAEEMKRCAVAHSVAHRLHFLGVRMDMAQYYAAADVFVCLSERESFGLAMAEAMASGKPCVYSKCPSLVELAGEECGSAVNRDDKDSIRDAVRRLAADSELRRTLGNNARRRIIQEYSITREASAVSELFDSVLSQMMKRCEL